MTQSIPATGDEAPFTTVDEVVDALADRTAEMTGLPGVAQVFPFENRGVEIGVTLHHPHGQIYAYDEVPDVPLTELRRAARGGCPACEPVDEARTYAEDTARWLAWYLGLPALAAGVAGWAWMTRDVVAARIGRLVPFLVTFSV